MYSLLQVNARFSVVATFTLVMGRSMLNLAWRMNETACCSRSQGSVTLLTLVMEHSFLNLTWRVNGTVQLVAVNVSFVSFRYPSDGIYIQALS